MLGFGLGLAVALALQAIPQAPAQEPPAIPDTPAGRTLKAWFEAFNSGDRSLMDGYLQKYDPGKPLDREMQFRSMTGGFDLLQIVKSEPLRLECLVKGRSDGITAFGKLESDRRRSRPGRRLCAARYPSRREAVGFELQDRRRHANARD